MKLLSLMMALVLNGSAMNAFAEQVNNIPEICQSECCIPCECAQKTNCKIEATKTNDLIPLVETSGPNGGKTVKGQGDN